MNRKTLSAVCRSVGILTAVVFCASSGPAFAQNLIIGNCGGCSHPADFDYYASERMFMEYGYWGGPDTILLVRSGGKSATAAYVVTWSMSEWPPYGWFYEPVFNKLTLDEFALHWLDQNVSGRAALMATHIDEMPISDIPSGISGGISEVDNIELTALYLQGNPQFSMMNVAGSLPLSQIAGGGFNLWNTLRSFFNFGGETPGIYVRVAYQDGSYAVYFVSAAVSTVNASVVYQVGANGQVIIYDSARVENIEGDPNLAANSSLEQQGAGTIEPWVEIFVGNHASTWYDVVSCYSMWDCAEGRKFKILIEGGW